MRAAIPALAAASALASLPTAYAWGAAGHEIVATIAQIHLPKPVLTHLCDVLSASPSSAPLTSLGDSGASYPACHLAPIAAWADRIRMQPQYRYTAPLHYINALDDVPPDACAFPGAHGWAGRPTGNVLAAIGNVTHVLREFAAGERGVADADEALKFLVHWVGDMHQPLHMSGREKGGNGARVAFDGRVTNLHSVWDSLLIAKALRSLPRNYTQPLPGAAGALVEPHLRGAIYDPYVRRIMHEGLSPTGRLAEDSARWMDCPAPSEPEFRGPEEQTPLALDALALTTKPGTEREWDDDTLCPYAWAAPIHALNCALPIWPHALDAPGTHPHDGEDEAEPEHAPEGDAEREIAWAWAGGRRPRHPELVELDTPEYVGRLAEGWVVERMLAMAGVRLAAILTDVFADAAGVAEH